MKKLGISLVIYFFLLSLIGCGGGGGSSIAPSSQPTDNPNSSDPSSPADGNPTTSIALSWETPISPTDGKPLADVAGYNIYYGKSPRIYSTYIDVGNVKTYTISNFPQGTYYFAITAYDSSGNETDFSNEVNQNVP
jgi:hypothetical protein